MWFGHYRLTVTNLFDIPYANAKVHLTFLADSMTN